MSTKKEINEFCDRAGLGQEESEKWQKTKDVVIKERKCKNGRIQYSMMKPVSSEEFAAISEKHRKKMNLRKFMDSEKDNYIDTVAQNESIKKNPGI